MPTSLTMLNLALIAVLFVAALSVHAGVVGPEAIAGPAVAAP